MAAAMTMTAVLTGCGTKQICGDWIFTEAEIKGTKVEIPSDTYASFSADITGKNEYAVYGKAGVNRYNGTAKTEGGTFSAQVDAMTMMGADTAHSMFERNFLEILSGAEKAAVSKENTLSFENIASTKMAGPKELMTQEMTFFKLLENVTSYRISGPELTLLDGDRTLVVLYLAD